MCPVGVRARGCLTIQPLRARVCARERSGGGGAGAGRVLSASPSHSIPRSQRLTLSALPHNSIKPGKIVIILNGRYAGRKAVVVKVYEEGSKDRAFGHCLVAGIDKYPLEVTKAMSRKKIEKRSRIKPFIKFVNYNHIMPTRYSVDIDVKSVVNSKVMANPGDRKEMRKELKKVLEQRYINRGKNSSGVQYLFHKLRF